MAASEPRPCVHCGAADGTHWPGCSQRRPESTTEADPFASVVTRRILKEGIDLRTLQAQRGEIERIITDAFTTLCAERDRYRAALEKYGDRKNWAGLGPCDDVWQWQRMNEPGWTIADEALRPKGGEGVAT